MSEHESTGEIEKDPVSGFTLSDPSTFRTTYERIIHAGWQKRPFPANFQVELPGGSNYKVTIIVEQTDEPVA